MERPSSVTQRLPRSSRLRALARRSASVAEGACAAAGSHVEATVQLARRVARNPFVPWKAWRKEKYGYAAVPTAALPPPLDIHTSLRSIKAHRNPVQQVPRNRMKQCSRKGRRSCVRRGPKVGSWGLSTSSSTSYSKAAVSPEYCVCSPASTSVLSELSSRPSSPVSAAAAPPLSRLSSRSFSLSTFSARSGSAVAVRPNAPCVPHRQQEQKRAQRHRARGRYHLSSSYEVGDVPWHHAPCARAARRGARHCWRSSLSAVLETGRKRWMLTDQGQHRQHRRVRGGYSDSLQHAERSYYWPAAALHCRAAFPPPCSCAGFHADSAAFLLSHTERLEARRLAFSASPDPCARSVVSNSPDSAAVTAATTQKCSNAAAVSSTAYAAAEAATASPGRAQRAKAEDLTVVGAGDNHNFFPGTVLSPAVVATSDAAVLAPVMHSASGASGAAASLPFFAYRGTDTCACLTKATSVLEKSHLPGSEYDVCDNSSSSYPSPGDFFITLHSFKCKARRYCDTPPTKRTTVGVEVDNIGSRTALVALCAKEPEAPALTRAADSSAILSGRTIGSSQAATGSAQEVAVSATPAASSSGQVNFIPVSETSASVGGSSTQVVVCRPMERSAHAEATAAATALFQSTTSPVAPVESGMSELSLTPTAVSVTGLTPGNQCLESGIGTKVPAACAEGGGECSSACGRICGRRCASAVSSASWNTLRNFAGAAGALVAHEASGRLLLVHAGGEESEAAACVAAGAGYSHASLSSSYELRAGQEVEQHPQYQQYCGGLLPPQNVRSTTQEQRGGQQQLLQNESHGAQPGGPCKVGRHYAVDESSVRRMHTESEGETDDSENGLTCRQKEELRWNCVKLTKCKVDESLQCALSR